MKPQCPTNCGRDLGANGVLCAVCWLLVSESLRNEIAHAAAIVKTCRTANKLSAAFRRHRDAKAAAIQCVLDKQKEKVSV